jgi:arylsulfatase A-like enzyme
MINRRNFIKLAGLLPLSFAAPRWTRHLPDAGSRKNVILLLFDAFTASDISLYGYQRETTPNLARLANRAVVYHNHYASSNFTTSGTASLLTAALPWTHRAIAKNGVVAPAFIRRTLFDTFDDYFRIAYTHNPWAYTLLHQFQREIGDLVPTNELLVKAYDSVLGTLFRNDEDIASVGWTRDVKIDEGYAYSLLFSHVDRLLHDRQIAKFKHEFPYGLPSWGNNYFLLEDAVDWLDNTLNAIAQPFLGYFHFLPPHAPYRPPQEYIDRFVGDGYRPVKKPVDVFGTVVSDRALQTNRLEYDQYILYADREFGRLFDHLEKSGLLQNTWLIVTSDHGEMFERGIIGHRSDALYEPAVHVPLMIFEPGRTEGMDVHTYTSAVDVLPTLAQVTGHPIPSWSEGTVLPPYSSSAVDPNRSIYVVRAVWNKPDDPITVASTMLVKGRYQLVYYFGFSGQGIEDRARLFDIDADPEEMNDIFPTEKDLGLGLLNEFKRSLAEANKPYL